jgi:hypothetical protein
MERNLFDGKASPAHTARLAVIAETADPRVRRALFWHHLASIIWEYRDDLIVCRWEDLTSHPLAEIGRILRLIQSGENPPQPLADREILPAKDTGENIDLAERQIILDLCDPISSRFGVRAMNRSL